MSLLSLSPEVQLILYCLVVLFASLAGGWLPALLHLNHARLQIAVSLVSGLMVGLALLHLLPHGAEELGSPGRASAWLLGGFLAMFFLQRFLPFHHHEVGDESDAHDHSHHHPAHSAGPVTQPLSWMGVAVGLSIHSLLDGLALAAAVVSSERGHGVALGLGTALAVILHKPFGAMAITTLIKATRQPGKLLHWVNLLFAMVTPIGAALFFVGAGHLVQEYPQLLGAALAFSAGSFLCIACADLLPELQFHSHDRFKLSLALLVGLGIAVLIGQVGHSDHDHDHDHGHEVEAEALDAGAQ